MVVRWVLASLLYFWCKQNILKQHIYYRILILHRNRNLDLFPPIILVKWVIGVCNTFFFFLGGGLLYNFYHQIFYTAFDICEFMNYSLKVFLLFQSDTYIYIESMQPWGICALLWTVICIIQIIIFVWWLLNSTYTYIQDSHVLILMLQYCRKDMSKKLLNNKIGEIESVCFLCHWWCI